MQENRESKFPKATCEQLRVKRNLAHSAPWIVDFIMPKSTITDQVDDHITPECLTPLHGRAKYPGHSINIVTVDVKDRSTKSLNSSRRGNTIVTVPCQQPKQKAQQNPCNTGPFVPLQCQMDALLSANGSGPW